MQERLAPPTIAEGFTRVTRISDLESPSRR